MREPTGQIYLVEGWRREYGTVQHWYVAAFDTVEAAEELRKKCQDWVDLYCQRFWNEFARQFGEPKERDHRYLYTVETAEQTLDVNFINPGRLLAVEWFGEWGDDIQETGLAKMRRSSPDPSIEVLEGNPCHYRVLVIPYGSTQPEAYTLGPDLFRGDK